MASRALTHLPVTFEMYGILGSFSRTFLTSFSNVPTIGLSILEWKACAF